MPVYEYKCPECQTRATLPHRANRFTVDCAGCGTMREYKRVFSFSSPEMMHQHFNVTVGKPISDMAQFKSELARASEAAEARTGIPCNYQPIDMADTAAVGATSEGIHESNLTREKQGAPLLPVIKD